MDEYTPEGSRFSMDIATLMRIDNLLKQLSAFQKIRHKKAILRHLRELHKEVYPFLKEDERVYADAFYFMILGGTNKKNPELFDKFDEFDFWLRDQLYIKGLLMRKSDDPRMAVLRR